MACFWLASLPFTASASSSLEELDAIVMQAGGVKAFLSDRNALDRYYKVYQNYVGGLQFTQADFLSIAEQAKASIAEFPEMENRLNESDDLGPSFAINFEDFQGHRINAEQMKMAASQWMQKLLVSSIEILEKPEVAGNLLQMIEAELKTLPNTKKKKADFFESFLKNAHLDKVASYALITYLAQKLGAAGSSQSSEQIDAQNLCMILWDLVQNPKLAWQETFGSRLKDREAPAGFAAKVKNLLPNQGKLLQWSFEGVPLFVANTRTGKEGEVLPDGKLGANNVVVIALPRRIHAIWKGLPLNECIRTCVNRWTTSLGKDSWIHYIEINGQFRGYVQSIPVTSNGKTYASIDLLAWPAGNRVITMDGQLQSKTIFELMLGGFYMKKPAQWEGFVLSESHYNDHAHVFGVIKAERFYREAQNLGSYKTFSPSDTKLSAYLVGKRTANNTYSELVPTFNATNKDAGTIRLVKPIDTPAPVTTRELVVQSADELLNSEVGKLLSDDAATVHDPKLRGFINNLRKTREFYSRLEFYKTQGKVQANGQGLSRMEHALFGGVMPLFVNYLAINQMGADPHAVGIATMTGLVLGNIINVILPSVIFKVAKAQKSTELLGHSVWYSSGNVHALIYSAITHGAIFATTYGICELFLGK